MTKDSEPHICLFATTNEVIALNVAVARHLALFTDSEHRETNRLLRQFQQRLTEHLVERSLPDPLPRQGKEMQHG
jgi:hypothetical protein